MDLITEPRQYIVTVLAAGICGTDDAVTLWNALGTELGRYPVNTAGSRDYIVQTNAATGTTFKHNLRGQYDYNFTVNCVGAAGPVVVIGAIGLDNAAAALGGAVLNTSPGIKGITQFSQIEAVTHALNVSGRVIVDDARAGSATLGIGRVLLTDEVGATPPDADIVQASAYLCITRTGDCMGSYA